MWPLRANTRSTTRISSASCVAATEWLRAHHVELVREQRRLRMNQLWRSRECWTKATRARRRPGRPRRRVGRTAREAKETARALEHLPHVAEAAHAGRLGSEQLGPVAGLAIGRARMRVGRPKGRGWRRWTSPAKCGANTRRRDEGQARREAPAPADVVVDSNTKTGMLNLRGQLADLDGALFENTVDHLIEQMRPAKGQPWTPATTEPPTRASSSAGAPTEPVRPCDRPVTPKRAASRS